MPSKGQIAAERLKAEIKKIWLQSKTRYGAPKIHKVLLSRGEKVSLKRIQRYMKDMKIQSIVVKKFRYHSEKIVCDEKENILNRNFSTTGINPKWCTDITYISTAKEGWTYLASVMDLHIKKNIGYAYDTSMTAKRTVKAVENACLNVKSKKESFSIVT